MPFDKSCFPRYNAALACLIRKKVKSRIYFGWSGTAGIFLTDTKNLIYFDPFISNLSLMNVLFSRLKPNEDSIKKYVKKIKKYSKSLDAIFVSHAHYDHVIDTPYFMLEGFQNFYGSESAGYVLKSYNIAMKENVLESKKSIKIGKWKITPIESLHGNAVFGRILFSGNIDNKLLLPARARDYKMGKIYSFIVEYKNIQIVHHGSAGYIEGMYENQKADILFLGVSGWQYSEKYFENVIGKLNPEIVIPIHYDDFFHPHVSFEKPFIPNVLFNSKMESFLKKLNREYPHIRVIIPLPHQLVPLFSHRKEK